MPEPVPTPKYELADHLLRGKLREFVESRRAGGLAWRHVASQLFTATAHKVDVTGETLRSWFPEDRRGDAEPDDDGPVAATG
jgi:hypothetical protein